MTLRFALDAGGSGCRLGVYSPSGELLAQAQGPPGNPSAMGIEGCLASISKAWDGIPSIIPPLDGALFGAGIAGAGRQDIRDALAEAIVERFPVERAVICDDLRPVLLANGGTFPCVAAVAGTGSSVMGHDGKGVWLQVGGRGPVFGDAGGAYAIAVAALQAAASAEDGLGDDTSLRRILLDAAGLTEFREFPAWTMRQSRDAIASLARAVATAASDGDGVAEAILTSQARRLAEQAAVALRSANATTVFLCGGVFANNARYRDHFAHALAEYAPSANPGLPAITGHQAALALLADPLPPGFPASTRARQPNSSTAYSLPPTERRIVSDRHLDSMTPIEIVDFMNREDHRAVQAVQKERGAIAEVVALAATAIRKGGRLIYIGAGTSGRLGVLDASECPPTFGVSPDKVIGIIAGGEKALRRSVEGAEDDVILARTDLGAISPPLHMEDMVIGLAASGTTPYVLSALDQAEAVGAANALVCCNPACKGSRTHVIALDTGPEVLSGSTRLKAGTATKLVLNMISTGAMALSGYVHDGLMVQVRPVNAKLRKRAIRLTAMLTRLPAASAEILLDAAEGSIPIAVLMHKRGLDRQEAESLLARYGSVLRDALK